MVDPGRLVCAVGQLAWWGFQVLFGMAIVISLLSKPTGTEVKDEAPGQRKVITGVKDGKVQIAMKVADGEASSTFILQDGNGRELMYIHLYKNGDYNFNFGDHLAARVAGAIRRERGKLILGVGNSKSKTEHLAELDGTPTLRVRYLADPRGSWVSLTPDDPLP
jgi:hypothetical protein